MSSSATPHGHAGVVRTPVGWVLPGVHDPDGHEVRFSTVPLEMPTDGDTDVVGDGGEPEGLRGSAGA